MGGRDDGLHGPDEPSLRGRGTNPTRAMPAAAPTIPMSNARAVLRPLGQRY